MSTETTNKKIKIDNGTTFGRTYTDKAVDELLKNAGGGGTSVIELIDKNGTIASAQLSEINAKPQNFAFKYSGKILLFTGASSTTYQYCNNTTNSSDNNVMTTSTLLTIESSTGVYTIAENVHNVVANSIHPVNGGDLTNIQVGSKVYSIPSGGGFKKVSINLSENTWDASRVDPTKDKNIIVINTRGISYGIANYLASESGPLGYVVFIKMPYPYEANYSNSVEYNTFILKLDGTIDKIYEGYYYDDTENSITFFNQDMFLGKDNYRVTSLVVPTLPGDASTKNYALNSINGTLTWQATSGGGGSNVKIFQPTITNVIRTINDAKKSLTFGFDVSNFEILPYLTTLIENNKPFTETLYLKTPAAEAYNAGIMFNTPLSLINTTTNIGDIYHCFYIVMSAEINIKGYVSCIKDKITLYLYFSNEESYTGFKQLTSSIFTNDTKIKITIKTDE